MNTSLTAIANPTKIEICVGSWNKGLKFPGVRGKLRILITPFKWSGDEKQEAGLISEMRHNWMSSLYPWRFDRRMKRSEIVACGAEIAIHMKWRPAAYAGNNNFSNAIIDLLVGYFCCDINKNCFREITRETRDYLIVEMLLT